MTIILSDAFRAFTSSDPLTYLDAGARGGLEGPWRNADDGRLRVVSFEPDLASSRELKADPDHIVVANGLWNAETELYLHLAETASASSVHPPNWDVLSRFRRQHADPRHTVRKERVACTTVDRVAQKFGMAFDFMKLDTQGAEYEILEGSRNELSCNVFGLICETWTQQVHTEQHVTHEVWSYLDSAGFEVVQISVAAAWQHRIVDPEPISGRAQLTGLDLLAFRRPSSWPQFTPVRAVKWAAIAELYGYPDIALELLDSAIAANPEVVQLTNFRHAIRQGASPDQLVGRGLFHRLLGRMRRRSRSSAVKLHY